MRVFTSKREERPRSKYKPSSTRGKERERESEREKKVTAKQESKMLVNSNVTIRL